MLNSRLSLRNDWNRNADRWLLTGLGQRRSANHETTNHAGDECRPYLVRTVGPLRDLFRLSSIGEALGKLLSHDGSNDGRLLDLHVSQLPGQLCVRAGGVSALLLELANRFIALSELAFVYGRQLSQRSLGTLLNAFELPEQ